MKKIIPAVLVFTPVFVFAAEFLDNVKDLITAFGNIVSTAIPIVVGLALLIFFWGLVKFIFAQGSEDAKEQGKRIMIWGTIALFVMVSIWGIVAFMQEAFLLGGNPTSPSNLPSVTPEGSNEL
ncbi:MAG: hypothetical protein CO183_01230 [Candidatus Zambryskibacteria bacterium CG_4_9_14_3_um_filter_42_9]|uniref:Uncharacterized protein n=1 Tax=Candidatus Zambryskibacteria bacterium CG22_combo_CG10-13_8_21_14_all_42_17 TaxID=1975118 RepID=A0A2H0BE34_9BACT|nr:MAG: hypothetical protein COX06_00495 [Candidatus Zambryskibacteria bacterium CG22_combo_CG10-13_8_21_14_all_42_17]PJA36872.1 MAG: hypothetical protein CO183_01230 [Candidatus Zambryskibacteria bacterium CG_4_9_14_3_um_filter_42_9]